MLKSRSVADEHPVAYGLSAEEIGLVPRPACLCPRGESNTRHTVPCIPTTLGAATNEDVIVGLNLDQAVTVLTTPPRFRSMAGSAAPWVA
jgi:hypothetical protein